MCEPDHQKVSPAGSSPCRQSCSSLFHARSVCSPATLQHLSLGSALNHSLNNTHTYRMKILWQMNCITLLQQSSLQCASHSPNTYSQHSHYILFLFLSYEPTCAVDTADAVCVLQSVFVQVSVQTEASLSTASNPLQLGQVHLITGRRPSSVALGDEINGGHNLAGRSVSGASLGAGKQRDGHSVAS